MSAEERSPDGGREVSLPLYTGMCVYQCGSLCMCILCSYCITLCIGNFSLEIQAKFVKCTIHIAHCIYPNRNPDVYFL